MRKLNNIKQVLAVKGVKQKEIAARLSINHHTVSLWCLNKTQPHLKTLYMIADILDVDVVDLLQSKKRG